MPGIYLILLLVMGASWFVSYRLKSKFKEYSEVALSSGLTGGEVAQKMLKDNGINDVKVISVEGFLTDHYNPLEKTVNLSPEVFNGSSVASAAVAAHECGHAVQHARAYVWLNMRSALVPVVQFSSSIIQWILLIGVLMLSISPALLVIGIILFALTTIFSLITLPVEIDASRRALAWMDSTKLTYGVEHDKAKDALSWAASTYVVAAVGSIATLLYYVSFLTGRRD
jgi:Zn-dependent membrane protease YugP